MAGSNALCYPQVLAMDLTRACVQAVKQMDTLITWLKTTHKCKATDPQMESAWEAKADVHARCGDAEGAQFCHRQALKCKSNLARIQKGR
jgi:Tfp pilus assembly protein PilF